MKKQKNTGHKESQRWQASRLIYEQRIRELLGLCTILNRQEILQYAHNNKWGLSDRQIDTYIRDCKDILKEEFDKFKETAAHDIYNNRKLLFKKALNEKSKDLRLCREILQDLAKMVGVDTANIDVTSKGEAINNFIIHFNDSNGNTANND